MQDQEKKLVERLKSGDRRAFEQFYASTYPMLFAYVQSKMTASFDAEELVHDVYLSFLDSLPVFVGRSSLKTFLYAIARHEIADYFRKKYAKKALAVVPFMDHLYTEKLYSSVLMNEEIEQIYRKLANDYVVILRLRYEEDMRIATIAKRLELSLKATESRLLRARKAFQKAYLLLYS